MTTIQALEKRAAVQTIEGARDAFGLNYGEVAGALGVDRRTVLRYRKLATVPAVSVRERLEKVREIRHLLDEVFASVEARTEWLYSPVPLLRGRRPIDLLRKGELDELRGVLAGLYSGAHA